jgi:sarcosine oxidase
VSDLQADVVVIGNGMFGSAVTRHLAERGVDVLCVGASAVGGDGRHAPEGDWPSERVYSSHNDAARLTRRHSRDPGWADIAARSVDGYADLEQRSGIDFHEPVGCLLASAPGGDGIEDDPVDMMRTAGIDHTAWVPGDRGWRKRWPALHLPAAHGVAYEPGPAGLIRPLRMIEAQNVLTRAAGGRIETGTVVDVTVANGRRRVTTANGLSIEADRIVFAAGAFTNLNGLDVGADITLKSEVIVLGEVAPDAAIELATYPTVKWLIESPDLQSIYMTPPIRFDDGRHYVKLGANTRLDHWMTDLDQIQRWFNTETEADYLPLYESVLGDLWPHVDFVSVTTRPCIITYTADHIPLIDDLGDGRYVITAGNGAGAKSADAWAERAADLVTGTTPLDLSRD